MKTYTEPLKQELTFREKIGYGVGDLASNIYFQTFITFLTFFYTDVFGLAPGAVATMFIVARIWDAVNDPIMGIIADRHESKRGKFRPFILWFAIPFGIFGALTFMTPDLSYTGKLIYAYFTYIILIGFYTIVNVPYSALMAVITADPEERTVLASYRLICAFIAGLIVQGALIYLVGIFGGGNEQKGWAITMSILSGFAVFLLFITYASTKERVKPPVNQTSSARLDARDLVHNLAWLSIGIASVFQLIFIVIRGGALIYYFKYFVKEVQLQFLGVFIKLDYGKAVTVVMISGMCLSLLAAVYMGTVAKKFDKKKTYIVMLVLFMITSVPYYFFKSHNFMLILVFHMVASFVTGALGVLQWSMFPDAADFSEWKHGRRATGLLMSASLFCIKLGLALGGAILAWILGSYGFNSNIEQTTEALNGIKMSMSIFPAIFAGVTLVCLMFYPINKQMLERIGSDLKKRRSGDENAFQEIAKGSATQLLNE